MRLLAATPGRLGLIGDRNDHILRTGLVTHIAGNGTYPVQGTGLQVHLAGQRILLEPPTSRAIQPRQRQRGLEFGTEGAVAGGKQQATQTARRDTIVARQAGTITDPEATGSRGVEPGRRDAPGVNRTPDLQIRSLPL